LDLDLIAWMLALGAGVGFIAGLLGMGGGMIMVPFMAMILDRVGFPADAVVKTAIATSLATILFTSASSVRAQHQRGAVRWDLALQLAPGLVLGSLIGAQLASSLRGGVLALIFGVFIAYMARQMLQTRKPEPDRVLPHRGVMFGFGSLVGVISAVVGAGGAFLMTPFMARRNVAIHHAIGTSAACAFPIAMAGSIGYAWAGWSVPMPDGTWGYLYAPALFTISLASMITAPLGVKVAHRTSKERLKKLFAYLLFVMAGYMLWRAWQYGL
jgi:uncharacterized membrane protein YfcA